MTENQWPQDGSYGTLGATQKTAIPNETLYPAPQAPSKTETAKQEAGEVAHQATDAAQHVVETAKTEAANVASEVRANAKDLLYQAKTDLTDQAGAQQQKVAKGLHSISGELRTMADASEQPGVATDLVRQAADRSSSVAAWLEDRDPGSLLDEVKSFARRRPGTFLLLAAGAGILAGRLTRSLSEGVPDSPAGIPGGRRDAARGPVAGAPNVSAQRSYHAAAGTAVPPPPVQLPGPDATTAGMADTGALAGAGAGSNPGLQGAYVADAYPRSPLANEGTPQDPWSDGTETGQSAPEPPLPGGRIDEDPYRDDPLRGGQR